MTMNKQLAIKIMCGILGLTLAFHLLIITKIIPYEMVWAGRLKSDEEMYQFETFSILINVLILIILYLKSKSLKEHKNNKVVNAFIWIFSAMFALNTVGNLFAHNTIELVLGTALTLASSVLCFIIVKKE